MTKNKFPFTARVFAGGIHSVAGVSIFLLSDKGGF
jgi:hypothetical protein